MSHDLKADGVESQSPRSLPPTAPVDRSPFPVTPATAQAWAEVLRVLRAEAEIVTAKEQRSVILHGIAELEESLLGDQPAAARSHLAAYNARSSFRPPLDALVRLYRRRASFANLGKLLEAQARSAPTARDKADALVLRGELAEDALGDRDAAVVAYEAAVAADPTHALAWADLERAALVRGDAARRATAVGQLAKLTDDPGRRAALLFELVEIHSSRATSEALEEALRCLHEAAAIEPARWRALVGVERLALRLGRLDDAASAMEARADLAAAVSRGELTAAQLGGPLHELGSPPVARRLAAQLHLAAARVHLSFAAESATISHRIERAISLDDDVRSRFGSMILADLAGEIEESARHAEWLLGRGFGDEAMRASLHFRCAERAALEGRVPEAGEALQAALRCDPSSGAARAALIEQSSVSGDIHTLLAQYERLGAQATDPSHRAALVRASALVVLLLRRDGREALRRVRESLELQPGDVVARRIHLFLLRRPDLAAAFEEPRAQAQERVAAIEALLPHVADADERAALLLEQLFDELVDLQDAKAAAITAEQLVEATGDAAWTKELAAVLWASVGSMAFASRWAASLHEALLSAHGHGGPWAALAARWAWAAGDEARAREIAVAAHRRDPSDRYLTALLMRLASAGREGALLLETAERAADADAAGGVRWLVLAASWLRSLGALDLARRALADASARAPNDPAVHTVVFASSSWLDDPSLRTALLARDDLPEERGAELVALRIEEVLFRLFVDRDPAEAGAAMERLAARGGRDEVAATLLELVLRGASSGADSPATAEVLRALLALVDAADPLRAGLELELARVLGATADTQDEAAVARDLIDSDQPATGATRLMSLLDTIQRDAFELVPSALLRLADIEEGDAREQLQAVALVGLWSKGRAREALALADAIPGRVASSLVRSELPPGGVEGAAVFARALSERARIAGREAQLGWRAAAANWHSVGGDPSSALAEAEGVLASRPDDVLARDVQRVASRRLGRWEGVAEACEALGRVVRDNDRAARFWEEAGVVSLEHLRQPSRAEATLREALERSPGRAVAYRLLRRLLEARSDSAGLEALVSRRLGAERDPAAMVALRWEQARLRRALGLREGALESAEAVVAAEPYHVAALALIAEIHAASGRLREAADALAALGAAPSAPEGQRRAALVGALEIRQSRLGDAAGALQVLTKFEGLGWLDQAFAQRAIALAEGAGEAAAAIRFGEASLRLADSDEARLAAHLRLVGLHADGAGDGAAAWRAVGTAHEQFPASLAVLRAAAARGAPGEVAPLARRTVEALRERLAAAADPAAAALDLSAAATIAGDGVLARAADRLARWAGAAVAVAVPGVPTRGSLRDPSTQLRVRAAADRGRATAMLEMIEPELLPMRGLTLDALHLGRGERVRGASSARDAVAPFAAACGVGDFELYLGGGDERILALPGEPLVLVLGPRVDVARDLSQRYRLVAELLFAVRGAGGWTDDDPDRAAARWLASLSAAGVEAPSADAALVRSVGKVQSRRVRKALLEYGKSLGLGEAQRELVAAGAGLRATVRRSALALSGAVGAAIADATRDEGLSAPPGAARRDAIQFAVSDALVGVALDLGTDHV
jgi:hypothetical protein